MRSLFYASCGAEVSTLCAFSTGEVGEGPYFSPTMASCDPRADRVAGVIDRRELLHQFPSLVISHTGSSAAPSPSQAPSSGHTQSSSRSYRISRVDYFRSQYPACSLKDT
ncbi:hypothetical protein BaRGS_00034810 [Batillaria attramentaria]|uniref:Uncharacterized protein n=1 Tax=Batillaria attramentaria TaxID=370345 RepID=A0ABD0JGF0_9CAEN